MSKRRGLPAESHMKHDAHYVESLSERASAFTLQRLIGELITFWAGEGCIIEQPYDLPVSLAIGDKVLIEACGAYTTTYSSIGFNGFPPLASVLI